MTVVTHWLNLTNGLEDLPDFSDMRNVRFMRMTSTDIEQENWCRVLDSIPDEMLFRLACGELCIIHDRGCRRTYSKTISQGIPFVRAYLCAAWGKQVQDRCEGIATAVRTAAESLFARAATPEQRHTKRRYHYYARWLQPDARDIHLVSQPAATEHDGDVDFYRGLIANAIQGGNAHGRGAMDTKSAG